MSVVLRYKLYTIASIVFQAIEHLAVINKLRSALPCHMRPCYSSATWYVSYWLLLFYLAQYVSLTYEAAVSLLTNLTTAFTR